MSGSGGFAVSRRHGGDRFYNPPAVRRRQQMLLQQQQQEQVLLQQKEHQHQLPRTPVKSEFSSAAALVEAGNRSDSDDSSNALSRQSSVRSASPPRPMPVNVTNLDRLMESVTPFISAQNFSEVLKNCAFSPFLFSFSGYTHYSFFCLQANVSKKRNRSSSL